MNNRRPDLSTPFSKARLTALKYISKPFQAVPLNVRFGIGFGLLVLLTTLLIVNPYSSSSYTEYKVGDLVRQTIVSPSDIIETDLIETESLRNAAAESVRPIFTFEPNRAEAAVQSFRVSWEDFRKRHEASMPNSDANTAGREEKTETHWTGAGGAEVGKVFASRTFTPNELDAVINSLRQSAEGQIYDDYNIQYLQTEITLLDRQRPNQQSIVTLPETSMTSLSAAREKLRERLRQIRTLSDREQEAFFTALSPLIQPSVAFDSVATSAARKAAIEAVPPVTITLKRGEVIAREGDTVKSQTLAQINAIRNYAVSTRHVNRFLGVLLFVAAMFWVAYRFVQHRSTTMRLVFAPNRIFWLIGVAIFLQTFLMSVGFRLAEFTSAQNAVPPYNDPTNWALIVPFASAALLVTLLIDNQIGLIVGVFTALVAGLLAPQGVEFALYAAISSAMAVYGFERYRSRQAVTFAGLIIGLTNAAMAVALIGYAQKPVILNTVLLAILCGFIGGLISAAVTAMLLPIFESLFGVLTDIKLLELSNADLPILGQLALRAPGTNQHSHAVGQLAQDACRVIGANPLLGRIGGLYHDIGKLAAPDYFVENQLGTNPHDKLKPRQSAKIIISHVTYGERLAREVGLPDRIIDFIVQHHGTRTMHYFLRKAQESCPEGKEVKEEDFRYPGPKPQFKESAVMMIADSCEAAARSLAHPTPENLRYIVNKIIDAILADDQLDECDLTLRELTLIRESMIKSLIAIYHARIDYPGFTPPTDTPTQIPAELGVRYASAKDIPISKGGEVEDEAVNRTVEPQESEKVKVEPSSNGEPASEKAKAKSIKTQN